MHQQHSPTTFSSTLNCHLPDMEQARTRHAVGNLLQADLFGVDPGLLCDEGELMSMFVASLEDAGFHLLHQVSHKFPGENAGVTGMVLLSESHAAFHTYPEMNYMALDVFSCGNPQPQQVVSQLCETLRPQRVSQMENPRGVVG